jgi:lipoate-protein ligase A
MNSVPTQPSRPRQPPSPWRVLGTDRDAADPLLARGLDLLDALAHDPVPTLRWYRATHPALVLGRGQGAITVRPSDTLTVVTRHSGGGAVLLDPHVLSLDVLVPAGHPWLADDDLSVVFAHVGWAWASGLRALGVVDVAVHDGPNTARRRGSPRERLLAAVCYATLGRGEVLADGRKLVGSSQRRRRPGALVQCGLLERWQPGPLLSALGADPDDPEILGAAVGLHQLLDPVPTEQDIRAAVERAFQDALG